MYRTFEAKENKEKDRIVEMLEGPEGYRIQIWLKGDVIKESKWMNMQKAYKLFRSIPA